MSMQEDRPDHAVASAYRGVVKVDPAAGECLACGLPAACLGSRPPRPQGTIMLPRRHVEAQDRCQAETASP
jgi:hypothetical protein